MALTHISLFSGIGCESIAAGWAGFETILHCEIDMDCQKVLRKNFPGVPIIEDVKKLEAICQEFVHIVGSERFLRVTQDVNRVIQSTSGNGDGIMLKKLAPKIESITEEESKRLSTITADGVSVVGSLKLSSFVWIIKTIMEMKSGKGITSPQSGKSPLKEDYQTISKSSAITAITRRGYTEYVHIKTNNSLISGGPPCQPASSAGKRRGKNDNRWLWEPTISLLKYLRPTWAVFENPVGIASLGELGSLAGMADKTADEIPDIENTELLNIISDIEAKGYTVQPVSISAASVGAPHKRQRIFIVCHTRGGGLSREPRWRSGPKSQNGCLEDEPTITNSLNQRDDRRHIQPAGSLGLAHYDSDVTNSNGGRCQQCNQGQRSLSEFIEGSSQLNPDSQESGLERTVTEGNSGAGRLPAELGSYPGWSENWVEVAQRLCSKTQSGIRSLDAGTSTGLPGLNLSRTAKLKMLGNCNPPQQYYPIFKAIADTERQKGIE